MLNQHMSIHKKPVMEMIHLCCLCEDKYDTLEELRTHMLTHTGVKPYSCTECDYKCMDFVIMNKHMNVHIGEKPEVNSKFQFPQLGAKTKGRHNSMSSTKGGAWNFDEIKRQQFIDELMTNDGFSMPFKNGKPI